ncbi:amidohydrolase family protein [Puia sp. P3]|uniref:amidohydrolase family protein n=1 Tax=Puia sp. P3 TaxID=3423952 RepID=UPI003D67A6A3
MLKTVVLTALLLKGAFAVSAQSDPHSGRQQPTPSSGSDTIYLLRPDRVFDGEQMHEGWSVLVHGKTIEQAGPASSIKTPPNTITLDLKGTTLLPGLIEGHSHLFLHPYNEVPWNDQVLKESRAERTARAVVHARATLMAGFTTTRDLGTEGCMYDDIGLKQAIEKGVVPGPHILAATRAIVATGSYGPKELSYDYESPHGAAEADGAEGLTKEIRTQIGKGADLIKIYVDYRWGIDGKAAPTFTVDELKKAVEAGCQRRQIRRRTLVYHRRHAKSHRSRRRYHRTRRRRHPRTLRHDESQRHRALPDPGRRRRNRSVPRLAQRHRPRTS